MFQACTHHLLRAKVGYRVNMKWLLHIAEICLGEFVGGRPGRQYRKSALMLFQEVSCLNMKADKIAIGEIVFRGKAVRRVEEEGKNEEDDQHRGRPFPAQNATAQRGHANDDHQWISRKHVPGEERTPKQ